MSVSVTFSSVKFAVAAAVSALLVSQQPTGLHNLLRRASSDFPGKAGLWVKHLTTGETAGVRDGEMFNSASVIKVPVLVLAFQMADKGAINLDERITIRKEDIRGGSGIFRYHDAGLQRRSATCCCRW
jgi:beta-lactamase class A